MPKFVKGQSGNPNGRPRRPEIELFREALAEVEKTEKKTLLTHAIQRAFKDDAVLVALLKKLLPDKLDLGDKDTGTDFQERKLKLVARMNEVLNEHSLPVNGQYTNGHLPETPSGKRENISRIIDNHINGNGK